LFIEQLLTKWCGCIIFSQQDAANCAQHSPNLLISQDNPMYFTKKYLDLVQHPIRTCAECKQEFGTTLKVGNNLQVWACPNTIKSYHPVCMQCAAIVLEQSFWNRKGHPTAGEKENKKTCPVLDLSSV
jgi:hypothetical protein